MNAPLRVTELDRSAFIGSTDIGAILGVSKWKTQLALYLEKIGQAPPPDPDREKLFRRGKRFEPIVIEMLAEERGIVIAARNQRYIDPHTPFFACEIDAEADIDGERVNIEIKTSTPFAAKQWGEEGTDEIDISYAAQAMFSLMVTGRNRCIFGVLIGSDNLCTYEIRRDEETIAAMRAKATRFWVKNVIAQQPPEPANMEDMLRLFARVNGRPVEADAAALALVEQLREFRQQKKRAEEAEEVVAFALADYVRKQWGDDAGTTTDDAVMLYKGKPVLTWKKQSRTTLDGKAIVAAHPELAAQFQRTAHFRVMRTVTPK